MAFFNPELTIMNWAGILIQGPMDGEFFNAEFQEDNNMLHVGSQGFTTFVQNANESGIVTITLSMKSPSNALLSRALRTQGMLLMTELDAVTTLVKGNAMIQKHAPIKRGKEVIGMEWKFLVAKMFMQAGGDA